MKKFLTRAVGVLLVVIAGVFVFRAPIFGALENAITSNMFLPSDTDAFDPGPPIGARFPAIQALYEDQEITAIDQFIGDKGAVFIAVRSVDW